MKIPNLLKLKYSAVIIVAASGILCYVSYRLGRIQDNQTLNSRDEQIYAIILTVAIPAGLGFSGWVIDREIKELSEGRVEQAKQEHALKIGRYQAMYSDALDDIRKKLEPLKDAGCGYEKCIQEIEKCKSIVKDFQRKDKAAREIADWLYVKSNRKSLREFILSEVDRRKIEISKHQKIAFERDLGRCINWLRDSILELQGYAVEAQTLASAHLDLPKGMMAYSVALNAIKTHPRLTEFSGDSMVLEDFVDELVNRLTKAS